MRYVLKAELKTAILSLLDGRVKIAHPSILGTGLSDRAELSSDEAHDEHVQVFVKRGWASLTLKETFGESVPAVDEPAADDVAPVEAAEDAPEAASPAGEGVPEAPAGEGASDAEVPAEDAPVKTRRRAKKQSNE